MKAKIELSLRRKKTLPMCITFGAWLFLFVQLFGGASEVKSNNSDKTASAPPAHVTTSVVSGEHPVATHTSSCPVPSSTFKPLTSFTFWGKTMNTSSPCPTAGLNNQLTMVLGLLHCSLQQTSADKLFRFKDITCSPTGGKDSASGKPRRQFRVGSDDYEYQWFRWSELFEVHNPIASHDRSLCLADTHTWSEHAWMKKCPTFVDHIYGTRAFWEMRKTLALHEWFQTLSRELIQHYGNRDSGSQGETAARPSGAVRDDDPPFLALHVRRGDYENFCRQTAKSSGVKKFRTAPFVWSMRATDGQLGEVGFRPDHRPKQLSSSFMSSCFPTTQKIVAHVGALCVKRPSTQFIYVATNSKSFLQELASGLAASDVTCARQLPIVTLERYLEEQNALGELKAKFHGYWGRRQFARNVAGGDLKEGSGAAAASTIAPAVITETEKSLLDVNILSFASSMVLNKYSTFSQSAIDFRMVREGTLNGTMIYWW
jgi:hypothetical protein